jgi:hypothetical protein
MKIILSIWRAVSGHIFPTQAFTATSPIANKFAARDQKFLVHCHRRTIPMTISMKLRMTKAIKRACKTRNLPTRYLDTKSENALVHPIDLSPAVKTIGRQSEAEWADH